MKKAQYFIGILFSPALTDKVQAIKENFSLQYGPTHALKTMPHITLIPPFYIYPDIEKALIKEITAWAQKQEPFMLKLKGFGYFKNKGTAVLYIGVEKDEFLETMHHDLIIFLNREFPFLKIRNDRPFHPHLTIAHRDLSLKTFTRAWPVYQHKKFEEKCRVTHFSLLHHNGKVWVPVNTFSIKQSDR